MTPGAGHPLAYPVLTTSGVLAICLAWAPFGDVERVSLLATVALIVLGYTGFRLAVAFGRPGIPESARGKRVRQQHRLLSRSWLEITAGDETRWLPVYFDPFLVTLPESAIERSGSAVRVAGRRVYPAGAPRDSEPPGRLIDNPTRPDPDGAAHAARAVRPVRRLVLDAQSAVVAPLAGLFWVYLSDRGVVEFVCATSVFAAAAVWFAAIRGSDPS
ncbi:hypothetical protein ACWDSJ_04335 [Nocardia sp. NPDC003482]